jgi:hypothetical protein
MKNLKKGMKESGGGGLTEVLFEKLPGGNEENQATFSKDSGVPPEIRTEHLSNTSRERYL